MLDAEGEFLFLMSQSVKRYSIDNLIEYEKQNSVKINHKVTSILKEEKRNCVRVDNKEELIEVLKILNADYFVARNALNNIEKYNKPLCLNINYYGKTFCTSYEIAKEEGYGIFNYAVLFC